MRLTIECPDQVVDVKWLYEQLERMQLVREAIPEGGHHHNCITIYDDAKDGYSTPDAFLLATDESYCDDGFRVHARVIFHTDGSAYTDPNVGDVDDNPDYAHGGGKRMDTWTKGTWADGLLALAQSVVGRLKILDAQKGTEINEALENLVSVIGETKTETAQIQVEE